MNRRPFHIRDGRTIYIFEALDQEQRERIRSYWRYVILDTPSCEWVTEREKLVTVMTIMTGQWL
jgi:hypothetical protein